MKLNGRRDGVLQPGFQSRDAFVGIFAAAGAVGNGNQTADQFVFGIALSQHGL